MTNPLLTSIANYHGRDTQLRQLMEECAELAVECNHTIRRGDISPGLIEEMADTLFVIKQVMFLMEITGGELEAVMEEKAEREAKRCGLL